MVTANTSRRGADDSVSAAMPSRGSLGGAPTRGMLTLACAAALAGRLWHRPGLFPAAERWVFLAALAGRPGADRAARAHGGAGRHAVLDRDADDHRRRRRGDHRRHRGGGGRRLAVPDRRAAGRRRRRPGARQHPGPGRPGAEDGAGRASRRHARSAGRTAWRSATSSWCGRATASPPTARSSKVRAPSTKRR